MHIQCVTHECQYHRCFGAHLTNISKRWSEVVHYFHYLAIFIHFIHAIKFHQIHFNFDSFLLSNAFSILLLHYCSSASPLNHAMRENVPNLPHFNHTHQHYSSIKNVNFNNTKSRNFYCFCCRRYMHLNLWTNVNNAIDISLSIVSIWSWQRSNSNKRTSYECKFYWNALLIGCNLCWNRGRPCLEFSVLICIILYKNATLI